MENRRKSCLTGTLVTLIVMLSSAAGILGFPDGASDGDKLPSACTGCHGLAGTGTVTLDVAAGTVEPGGAVEITVTVTEPVLGASSLVGVFLLKGPAGVQESVVADRWTILSDPNGGTHNYVEKDDLSSGTASKFVWSLKAPGAAGDYEVHAMAVHGGSGAASERSDAATITVAVPEPEAEPHPVIADPELPASVLAGTVHEITVRIIDGFDGVQAADLHYTHPGSRDAGETSLELKEGTPQNGLWSADLDVGKEPGALELYLTASDGKGAARSPAEGAFVLSVLAPGMPEISPPSIPDTVETGTMLRITVPMTDSDGGVQIAVLRYRLPGNPDYATVRMSLCNGCAEDGVWAAEIETGPEPGVLELCLAATDGENDVSSPATGCYSIQVVRPAGPALAVEAASTVPYGGSPEVRARVTDGAGVTGVRVLYRLNGEKPGREAEMVRQSGDERDGVYSVFLSPASSTGEYRYVVVAGNALSESRSDEMTMKVLPDLQVVSVEFSKKHLIVKDDIQIRAVISNHGDREITGLTVQFLELSYSVGDARNIRFVRDVTVPANGIVTVSAGWMPQVVGERDIGVVLNPDGKVEDANPENDRATAKAEVGLEAGMGVRFPIPSPADMWAQLAVIAGAAVAVGVSLFYGLVMQERRGKRRAGKEEGDRTAGKRA